MATGGIAPADLDAVAYSYEPDLAPQPGSDLTADASDLAVRSRAAGYFHVSGLGDALVRANGWDELELARYRDHPVLAMLGGRQADKALPREQLVEVSRSLPEAWIEGSAAQGDAATCTARLREYLAAGADELILHGGTAEHFGTLAAAFTDTTAR